MASWWHQLFCLSTVLVEEMALGFTENHVPSYYPLPCQGFRGVTNLGFPPLAHSGSTGNMAATLALSQVPGMAPRGYFGYHSANTTRAS